MRRERRGAPQGGGCDRHRQDQSRSIRDRAERHAFALRNAAQRIAGRPRARRIELRFGLRRRSRYRACRARYRYGGFWTRAGRIAEHRGAQAEPRTGPRHGRRPRLPHPRLRLGLRPDGRGCLGSPGSGGRGRSGRSVLQALAAREPGRAAARHPAGRATPGRSRLRRRWPGAGELRSGPAARCGARRRDRAAGLRTLLRGCTAAVRRALGRRALAGDPRSLRARCRGDPAGDPTGDRRQAFAGCGGRLRRAI